MQGPRTHGCGARRPSVLRKALYAAWMLVSAPCAAQLAKDQQPPSAAFPSAGEHATAALTYHIIDAPGGTYGYDILSDGRLLIHQTNLPGRPGNEGCRTREQAGRLAQLVITKIQRGEMPPTITQDELKTLEIP